MGRSAGNGIEAVNAVMIQTYETVEADSPRKTSYRRVITDGPASDAGITLQQAIPVQGFSSV